jgi:RNA polymerase sigma-70 factor (ECF subfamily)
VRRHLGAALAVARSKLGVISDAEDVCQEAFMSALKNINSCRNPARFRTWLLVIVKNRAHNKREYEAVRDYEPLEEADVRTHPAVDRRLELAGLRRDIESALVHLTELQQRVMLLHDMEGWAHSEIAKRLQISNGSSRVHLHAARKRMRKHLRATENGL